MPFTWEVVRWKSLDVAWRLCTLAPPTTARDRLEVTKDVSDRIHS